MKKTHRCSQTQCSYYVKGGCKECKDCKEKPYVINDSCDTCIRCEKIPDNLRFGDNENIMAEYESEGIEKVQHSDMKNVHLILVDCEHNNREDNHYLEENFEENDGGR